MCLMTCQPESATFYFQLAWQPMHSFANRSPAEVVTPATAEPLTLSEAKKHLELSDADTTHDEHLIDLIASAREQWEKDTDSVTMQQTLRVTFEEFGINSLVLPKRPVQSITSIQYYDSGNNLQTLATSVYNLDRMRRAVRLLTDEVWPAQYNRWDAIQVDYVCGYASRRLVPAIARQAIKLLIGHYFANREMLSNDLIYQMRAYEMLVRRYMRATYP